MGFESNRVSAIGAVDTETVESRLTSIGVIKRSPLLFLVFTTLEVGAVVERIRQLVPLTRHLWTIIVLAQGEDRSWRAERMLDVEPDGVGTAVTPYFSRLQVTRLNEAGEYVDGDDDEAAAPAWILLHSTDSDSLFLR